LPVQTLSFHLLHQLAVGMVLAMVVVEMVVLVGVHKIRMAVELEP
jgi:hypothetical protein